MFKIYFTFVLCFSLTKMASDWQEISIWIRVYGMIRYYTKSFGVLTLNSQQKLRVLALIFIGYSDIVQKYCTGPENDTDPHLGSVHIFYQSH